LEVKFGIKPALEIIVEARSKDSIENALRKLDAKGYRFEIKGEEL